MKFHFFISLFIVIIFILSCEFKDRTNPLDPNNVNGARSLQVPSVYSTIQMAVDNAENGDTIIVDTDTLRGDGNRNISFNGKSVLLKSKYGADSTIIDIETEGRAFIFNNEEDSLAIVDGFKIINGYVKGENDNVEGGAIFIDNASPTIKNCIFSQNLALIGGAIYLKQSLSLLDNLTLETNFSSQGHAIHIDHLSNSTLFSLTTGSKFISAIIKRKVETPILPQSPRGLTGIPGSSKYTLFTSKTNPASVVS